MTLAAGSVVEGAGGHPVWGLGELGASSIAEKA